MNTIGIRNAIVKTAQSTLSGNTTLTDIALSSAIAANETQKLYWWLRAGTSANAGLKAQITVPAGGILFLATFASYLVGGGIAAVIQVQQASAVYNNGQAGLANTQLFECEATIVNGNTPGNVSLLMAPDLIIGAFVVSRGSYLDINKL